MPKLRGVLLDLDGTLANTEDYNYAYATNKSVEELLEYKLYQFLRPILKVISWEEFIELYVRANKEIKAELHGTAASHNRYLYIQKTLELCGINFVPDIIQRAVDFYFDEMLKKTELYPGVLEGLKQMKFNQLKTCMITDFTADIQIRKIRKLGIMKYIDYMVTSEEAGADKPHVEQAVLALKKLHLRQEEVVMIGNNPKTDIELAHRFGLRSVLFDPRGLYQNQKGKETFYAQDFSEVMKWLGVPKVEYSRKKLLVLDFVGTLTTEKSMIEEVLGTFVRKDPAFVSAEYQLFRQGTITESEFWFRVGVSEVKKAHKAIDAAITIRRSVISLLEKLKKKYKLVLLTDFPQQWGRQIFENRGLDRLFDRMIFGGDTDFVKPDARLYNHLLTLYPDISPENIALVDDTQQALASGRDLLMHTILVENAASRHTAFVPDTIIKDILDLGQALEKNERVNR